MIPTRKERPSLLCFVQVLALHWSLWPPRCQSQLGPCRAESGGLCSVLGAAALTLKHDFCPVQWGNSRFGHGTSQGTGHQGIEHFLLLWTPLEQQSTYQHSARSGNHCARLQRARLHCRACSGAQTQASFAHALSSHVAKPDSSCPGEAILHPSPGAAGTRVSARLCGGVLYISCLGL